MTHLYLYIFRNDINFMVMEILLWHIYTTLQINCPRLIDNRHFNIGYGHAPKIINFYRLISVVIRSCTWWLFIDVLWITLRVRSPNIYCVLTRERYGKEWQVRVLNLMHYGYCRRCRRQITGISTWITLKSRGPNEFVKWLFNLTEFSSYIK